MGIIKSFESGHSNIGIWHISEEENLLRSQLNLTEAQEDYISKIKGFRRTQWLAGRLLLSKMLGVAPDWSYDEFGKPHLKDSNYDFSISHSMKRVAVMLSEDVCGVDIQHMIPRIISLKERFCSEGEMNYLNNKDEIEMLHIIWGAKEALYKAYGRRSVDFREDMIVELDDFTPGRGIVKAFFNKEDFKAVFNINYENDKDFMLVWAERVKPILIGI